MAIEFFEVNFAGPIDAGQFVYAPGSLEVSDQTETYLRSLVAK
jgi:hypothetical protein